MGSVHYPISNRNLLITAFQCLKSVDTNSEICKILDLLLRLVHILRVASTSVSNRVIDGELKPSDIMSSITTIYLRLSLLLLLLSMIVKVRGVLRHVATSFSC